MNARDRIAVLLATLLGGVATLPAFVQAQAVNPPSSSQSDGRQQATDQAITVRVKAALQLDSELKTQTILVDTVNGSVRLTGQATSAAIFDRAREVVARVDGVTAVDNQLVVKALTSP
jgi:hyperosmotically inducible protein